MNQSKVIYRRPSIDIILILIAWIIGAAHMIKSKAFRPSIWKNYKILDGHEAKDWNKFIITLRETFSSPPAGLYLHGVNGFLLTYLIMKLAFFIGGINAYFSLTR